MGRAGREDRRKRRIKLIIREREMKNENKKTKIKSGEIKRDDTVDKTTRHTDGIMFRQLAGDKGAY